MADANDYLFEKLRAARASRLRWLVGIQVVLASTYAWTPLIPWGPRASGYDSLIWAACGISQAPVVLLAFWCALGTSGRERRRIGGIIGVGYLAACSVVHEFIYQSYGRTSLPLFPSGAGRYSSAYGEQFVSSAGHLGLIVSIFVLVLLLARRWIGELQYFDQPDDDCREAPSRYQYSIGHLVIATTLAAVVCGLSRGAAAKWPAAARFDWQGWAQQALFVIAFLTFVLVVARATLTPGRIRGRLWRAALACVLVSWTYTLAMPSGDLAWWLKAWWWLLLNSLVLMGLPAAIIIISMLVLRSCGYRLVIANRQSLSLFLTCGGILLARGSTSCLWSA